MASEVELTLFFQRQKIARNFHEKKEQVYNKNYVTKMFIHGFNTSALRRRVALMDIYVLNDVSNVIRRHFFSDVSKPFQIPSLFKRNSFLLCIEDSSCNDLHPN